MRLLRLKTKFAFLYVISAICSRHSYSQSDTVDYYKELIGTRVKHARNFHPYTDANMYKPKFESSPKDFGTYDFIIIGAGSTGTVIANRLSEITSWKILLLEAGTYGDNFTQIPAMGFETALSNYNWGYKSIPQKTACLGIVGEICPFPRGKGVGGSTLINGLAYVRGNPIDYDRWAEMGNPGWSYTEVLPYFKKSEDFNKNSQSVPVYSKYHASRGYLPVEYYSGLDPFAEAFLQANRELGYNLTDYNSARQIGASPTQQNTKHGRRADGGSTFILPVLERHNLNVMTNSFVTKISIDRETKTAKGVCFSHNRKLYEARVNREVIVSAGAISSPQLLMLSGIGPRNHLRKFNIPVIEDLEVGSTLRDHSQYYGLNFASNVTFSAGSLTTFINEYLMGTGPFTIAGPNVLGFYQTSLEKIPNYPNIELIMIRPNATSEALYKLIQWKNETYEAMWGALNLTSSFSIHLINLHQLSVGTIRLRSDSPYDYPLIDPQFLSDSEDKDIQTLYEGIQFVMKLISTKAFQKIGAKYQVKPLHACKEFKQFSKDYWYCSLRQLSYNVYHPVGTCPMGSDLNKGAVVDNKLKVYGIKNLRVADASIFPFTLSGHPNAPCVMIGEKVSDLIKLHYGKLEI